MEAAAADAGAPMAEQIEPLGRGRQGCQLVHGLKRLQRVDRQGRPGQMGIGSRNGIQHAMGAHQLEHVAPQTLTVVAAEILFIEHHGGLQSRFVVAPAGLDAAEQILTQPGFQHRAAQLQGQLGGPVELAERKGRRGSQRQLPVADGLQLGSTGACWVTVTGHRSKPSAAGGWPVEPNRQGQARPAAASAYTNTINYR